MSLSLSLPTPMLRATGDSGAATVSSGVAKPGLDPGWLTQCLAHSCVQEALSSRCLPQDVMLSAGAGLLISWAGHSCRCPSPGLG